MLGHRCYPALNDIPEPVDVVDCFRPTRNIPPLAREAIDIGAKVLWMQLGIVNEAAAALARGPGLEVILNRCMKADFARLFGDLGWVSVDTKVIVKKVKIFLGALLLLGICSNGHAHNESLSLPVDPLTDEYYQAFRGFYYDSYHMIFEVIGSETVALPLEDFTELSLEAQINVCLVGMDYVVFNSTMTGAAIKTLRGRPLGSLTLMLFADLTGISWDFKRELSEEEKDTILQINDIFKSELKLNIRNLRDKFVHCIRNRLVKKSGTYEFTEGYASVPIEFQVRDIYRSQIPLIRWLQENMPKSEEKDIFRTMVESMERKYSIF